MTESPTSEKKEAVKTVVEPLKPVNVPETPSKQPETFEWKETPKRPEIKSTIMAKKIERKSSAEASKPVEPPKPPVEPVKPPDEPTAKPVQDPVAPSIPLKEPLVTSVTARVVEEDEPASRTEGLEAETETSGSGSSKVITN